MVSSATRDSLCGRGSRQTQQGLLPGDSLVPEVEPQDPLVTVKQNPASQWPLRLVHMGRLVSCCLSVTHPHGQAGTGRLPGTIAATDAHRNYRVAECAHGRFLFTVLNVSSFLPTPQIVYLELKKPPCSRCK